MIRLDTSNADFWSQLQQHTAWEESANQSLTTAVSSIIADVRARGDAAVIEYTNRFDRQTISEAAQLELPRSAWLAALEQTPKKQVEALQFAADRVRMYAEHQRLQSWSYTEADGTVLGQRVTALDRVGLYAPGGKAAYPSSVIMNAIPAKVAGVGELILVSPTPDGKVNPLVLAAAAIANVDRVFCIGGAQAVAALAYGTQTIPAVDKIVGPGNSYVATAKRLVFGKVGIDMIAGPSEVLIIADSGANPDWVAMDLFAQAEHDEVAQSILVSADETVLQGVAASINRLLPQMERRDIISVALKNRGLMIHAKSWDECCEIANFVAPEHLELAVANASELADKIRHAGAVFLGHYSAEVLGDYCAGPNHVLPTARTARFASPLGVYDFQKRTSLIHSSRAGAAQLADIAATLAYGEGLTAHARSAEYRGAGDASNE